MQDQSTHFEREGNDFLNKIEKESLERLNESPVTLEALKKVLLSSIYYDGTLSNPDYKRNFTFALGGRQDISDEQMGRHLRACIEAVRILGQGFNELASFKKVVEQKEKYNPAI